MFYHIHIGIYLTAEYDELSDDELRMCLDALRIVKAPGFDNVPIEAYHGSEEATKELFRICQSYVEEHGAHPGEPSARHVRDDTGITEPYACYVIPTS